MKKSLLLITALSLFLVSFGQTGQREYSGFFDSYYYKGIRNLAFTGNLGTALYQGDLTSFSKPGIAVGFGVNYKVWPRVMFGAEFHYLQLAGADHLTNRNISFKSSGTEFLAYGRFYFIDDIVRVAADRTRPAKFLKIYGIAGLGLLSHSPKSYYSKPFPPTDTIYMRWTEGGGGMVFTLPVGIGLSWRVNERINVITELAYRFTFTDYLDQVSQRGNPKTNDGYAVLDLKLQYAPWAPRKKKKTTTTPPDKYDGPKGTETWKNRKKEEPVKKNNNYYDETTPEEAPAEGTPTEGEEQPTEDNGGEEAPTDELK